MKFSPLYIIVLAILLVGTSCSEYNKVLKSDDLDLKYERAIAYFNEEECYKASAIFEQLIPLTRGTARSEEIYYYYAQSIYCQKDYILAGYYFETFVKTFPNSRFSEECAFLSAICKVKESPDYSLDQGQTIAAIDGLQLFVDQYPETSRKDTINYLVKEMRAKLEVKSFESAKLYHRIRRYKSAVIALENALIEYPDSRYREEMSFLLLSSHFELATNSVESKKEQRLRDAVDSYHNFVDNFENSPKLKEASNLYDTLTKLLENYGADNQ